MEEYKRDKEQQLDTANSVIDFVPGVSTVNRFAQAGVAAIAGDKSRAQDDLKWGTINLAFDGVGKATEVGVKAIGRAVAGAGAHTAVEAGAHAAVEAGAHAAADATEGGIELAMLPDRAEQLEIAANRTVSAAAVDTARGAQAAHNAAVAAREARDAAELAHGPHLELTGATESAEHYNRIGAAYHLGEAGAKKLAEYTPEEIEWYNKGRNAYRAAKLAEVAANVGAGVGVYEYAKHHSNQTTSSDTGQTDPETPAPTKPGVKASVTLQADHPAVKELYGPAEDGDGTSAAPTDNYGGIAVGALLVAATGLTYSYYRYSRR